MRQDSKVILSILAACLAVIVLVCCVCLVLFGGLLILPQQAGSNVWSTLSVFEFTPEARITLDIPGLPPLGDPGTPVPTPELYHPELALTPGTPNPTIQAAQSVSTDTLKILEQAVVPVNDPVDLAQRLKGVANAPRALAAPAETYQVGDTHTFWVTNSDNDENFEVQARLAYIGEHAYFWVQQGVSADDDDVKAYVDTFDQKIYPTDRAFFGSEWTPGVDADPRLFILYARGLGGSVAGYFSSVDSYLPQVQEKSNAHEMFVLSAEHLGLQEEFAYGVLAHEFQHMIHWYTDRNEETWMNEGFADLAMLLNNYDIGGADRAYIADTDLQLTDWPSDGDTLPHYGAAFLFLNYFLDRFGEDVTKTLVAEQSNGMVSIDRVLAETSQTDPQTGQPITADDVFTDWTLASYLHDDALGDGRYTYHNNPSAPQAKATETISDCPTDTADRTVSQYGVDYIRIRCKGDYSLRFTAPQFVDALPADPHSGDYAFYSNRGDESDITLTRSFDFTSLSGPIDFSYWTWYDLEENYDYLYLLASEDAGQTWQFIKTPSGTDEDPVGNSYGWGYNGLSANGPQWIEERVDLSAYAGKQVLLRFEYITDAAVNGEGFLLDDVSIPQIDYTSDFEQDDGGWQADGFVRIQNVLPQTFRLSLIYLGQNPRVEKLALPASNAIEIPLSLGSGDREVILVVSGTSRFTRQKAFYQFSLVMK